MINKTLSLWIAQSESWQTFIDFKLPEEAIAKYPFLKRPDDFYISLFGEMYDILENLKEKSGDILSVAKGMEIFSLLKKRENFYGVNPASNILFAAGLYYLADYSASAFILANLFEVSSYERDIDRFLFCFLKRKLIEDNQYCRQFADYLKTGNKDSIQRLLQTIQQEKDKAFESNAYEFSVFYMAEAVLSKFIENNIWNDLSQHNTVEHWNAYVDKATKKRPFPVWDFFPSQRTALGKGVLDSFKSLSLQTPTSSGKTAICELLIYNEVRNNPNCKVLYLAPFRALAAELKQSFGTNLSELNITSKTIYGGNIPTAGERELIQNVTLLISTPEKFMALENSIANFLKDFTMIICDEGHLLDDGTRGLNYELLLSRLKSQKDVQRKFIFISAIIPNIDKINTWLGGSGDTVVRSTYRSTEIEYAFLKEAEGWKNTFYLDVNPFKSAPQKYQLINFLTRDDFVYRENNREKVYKFQTGITKSVAIARKALNSGSVALFASTKGKPTGVIPLANELIKQLSVNLNLPKPADFVKNGSAIQRNLKEYFKIIFGANYPLTQLVEHGAVFHTGDLPQYVREVIEDAIRKEETKFVICTNTLAEGVNLPIRTIVISSAKRYDPDTEKQEPIPLRDLKNLVGRAGRAGKETKGLIIITNPKDFDTIEQVIKDQNLENVDGYLYFIVGRIAAAIRDKRLALSNEILEAQDEAFQELIDTIDISIIDLLAEEIKPDELKETVQSHVNETFAKFQSNQEEATTLDNLINLRGEKLRPYIEKNEFKYIKQSGATIRNYQEIMRDLDVDNPIWQNLDNPVSPEWLNFLLDSKVANFSVIKYKLSEFNKVNKTNLTFTEIKNAVKLWINGRWFEKLSEICGGNVDVTLRLIHSFIGYQLQSICASIIRNVEMRLVEKNLKISKAVLNFPQYLIYGFKSPLQIDLIEIGFNDRIGIIALSEILVKDNYQYEQLSQFRRHLRNNREEFMKRLQSKIPIISLNKMQESFRYLSYNQMK